MNDNEIEERSKQEISTGKILNHKLCPGAR